MTPPPSPDTRSALDDVSRIGPFFAATANPAEVVDDSWRPLRELYTDPAPLAARIRQVGEALGVSDSPGDRRIAASIAYQGLAARLVSPLIAVASVHRIVPCWSPDTLHWRPAAVGPWPLWESTEGTGRGTGDYAEDGDLAGAVADVLVEPHLGGLAAAAQEATGVSERTLWGNAASAIVAAGRLVAEDRPSSAGTARAVVAGLLATGQLAPAGAFGPRWAFRRRSCCLYYKVPGGGTCGDCVLTG